jgi:uncharacterized protein YecE (DUF72 family)
MLLVGCSGFPVPATKYLREFMMVEVADTFLGVPGPALVRRWKREAPQGFVFTAVAPRELTLDAFKPSGAADAAWEAFLPVCRDLDARAIVVTTPPEIVAGKVVRGNARGMFERIAKKGLPPIVWEPPPSWELKDAETTVKDLGVLVCRDPSRHAPFAKGSLAYYRLPGQAGHKSRYEDPPLEHAAKTLRETQIESVYAVFANVDMYADSKRLRSLIE